MNLLFNEEDHTYHSIDNTNIKWTSVTSVISKLKKPFDAKKIANKVSKNKKSKWYNLKPTKIIEIWNKESKRATDLGTFGRLYSTAGGLGGFISFNYLDSPSTTSATTYTYYHKVGSGTGYVSVNNYKSNLTLLEIAG